jgi:protein-tyrosine phosphatase
MQITAGSLAGTFGRGPRYWAEHMLGEGLVDILATDAHDTERRPPNLGLGRDIAAKSVGAKEANKMVFSRPYAILSNQPLSGISDRSSGVVPPGMVYSQLTVKTGRQNGGSTGSFRSDADRSVAGRLRRLFK